MLTILKFIVSIIYSFFVSIRNFLYNHNIKRGKYFNNINTISVGNIAIGGTGKTPHIEFFIKLLKPKYKIAVLSRGYKRKTKGFVYSTNETTYSEIGDEPFQIANKNKDIQVAVCESRVEGVKKLKNEKDINLILLDDAHQHRKIIPKVSVLLTEFNNPFFKDHFFPLGRLRDNKSEYRRADIIIVSNCPENLKPIEKNIWRDNIKLLPYQNLYFTYVEYTNIKKVKDFNSIKNVSELKNHDVLLVTGIANHKYLFNHIEKTITTNIKLLKYQDHKNYTEKHITEITKEFNSIKNENKIIITTEKDAVRLKPLITEEISEYFYFQEIEVNFLFDMQQKFEEEVLTKLSQS